MASPPPNGDSMPSATPTTSSVTMSSRPTRTELRLARIRGKNLPPLETTAPPPSASSSTPATTVPPSQPSVQDQSASQAPPVALPPVAESPANAEVRLARRLRRMTTTIPIDDSNTSALPSPSPAQPLDSKASAQGATVLPQESKEGKADVSKAASGVAVSGPAESGLVSPSALQAESLHPLKRMAEVGKNPDNIFTDDLLKREEADAKRPDPRVFLRYSKGVQPAEFDQKATEEYVESKSDGAFVRVKKATETDQDLEMEQKDRLTRTSFAQVVVMLKDTSIILFEFLHAFILLCHGVLAGVVFIHFCLLFRKNNYADFLSYYAVLIDIMRVTFFLLLSVTTATSITRVFMSFDDKLSLNPNPGVHKALMVLFAIANFIAYICTLVAQPIDDNMSLKHAENPRWFSDQSALSAFEPKLSRWFTVCWIRIGCCVFIWLAALYQYRPRAPPELTASK